MTQYLDETSVLPLGLNVSAGKIDGLSYINKFGHNPVVTTTTDPEDMWTYGGLYTFPSSAATLYVSSSDDTDDGVVNVQGLDANWAMQTKQVTLTGQTQAAIDGTWISVFRAWTSTATSGDVYIAEQDGTISGGVPQAATKIKAQILIADQQTEMAIYTVPAGKQAWICGWWGSILGGGATKAADLDLKQTTFGSSTRTLMSVGITSIGTSYFHYKFCTPQLLDEKTDLYIRIAEVTATCNLAGGFDLVLRDK